jgi:D-glycero-D-manno-heptose 1,7-bisphosphate phosphatase
MKRAALFFDRDGVLNVDCGYIGTVDRFEWQTGAIEAIRLAKEAGLATIVVTNQSGVARGLFSEEQVRALHDWMNRELSEFGAVIDAFYYCPYHGDATLEEYRIADHWHRKPNPGMILQAMEDFGIDPARSFLIGDKESDMEAARRAGINRLYLEGGDMAQLVRAELGLT